MKKLQSIQRNLEALLARDNNLKESAQRAFVAYIKSVFLMKDKEVFNVAALDTDAYSKYVHIVSLSPKTHFNLFNSVLISAFFRSLGLAISPRIRFLQKRQKMLAEKAKKEEHDEQQIIDKINNDNTSENDDVVCEDDREKPAPKYKNFQKNIPLNFYEGR